jgi:Ca2+-binding EF-hand superfamily protein
MIKQVTFDPNRDELKAKFKEIAHDSRLKKEKLQKYLAQTYQGPIADLIVN